MVMASSKNATTLSKLCVTVDCLPFCVSRPVLFLFRYTGQRMHFAVVQPVQILTVHGSILSGIQRTHTRDHHSNQAILFPLCKMLGTQSTGLPRGLFWRPVPSNQCPATHEHNGAKPNGLSNRPVDQAPGVPITTQRGCMPWTPQNSAPQAIHTVRAARRGSVPRRCAMRHPDRRS